MKSISPLALTVLLALCIHGRAESSILEVRAHIEVSSSSVRLADLLEASDHLPRDLRESKVMAAPSSGRRQRISIGGIPLAKL